MNRVWWPTTPLLMQCPDCKATLPIGTYRHVCTPGLAGRYHRTTTTIEKDRGTWTERRLAQTDA